MPCFIGDFMAVDAVVYELFSPLNSLLAGKFTGNSTCVIEASFG
jgi:hypothetical protein